MRAFLSQLLLLLLCSAAYCQRLSEERVVFETKWGRIEFAFMPDVAPITTQHIFKLVTLGGYDTNNFFRIHKGFVAQTSNVDGGRTAPFSSELMEEAEKTVPLEVKAGVGHAAGVLSMGRYDDPDSGTSSFSMLLAPAPFLDMKYTIFGRVTKGQDTLDALQQLETVTEGMFVMPTERVEILSSYWYIPNKPFQLGANAAGAALAAAQRRVAQLEGQVRAQTKQLQQLKARKCAG